MKKNLLVFLLGLAPLASNAEVISEEQAMDIAAQFFNDGKAKATRSTLLPLKMVWNGQSKSSRTVSSGAPAFYVFNRGENQGFIIVSGDDAVRPVLAYAYEGTFGTTGIPKNLEGWMLQVESEINEVREQQLEPTAEVSRAWKKLSNGKVVAHLVTPWWNQTKPYNTKCPGYPGWGDWRAYTGCTMTATAIVMGFHQWPDRGVGALGSYTAPDLGVVVDGVDFSDHPYRWEKMPDINGNILPQNEQSAEYLDQEDAISTLMRDLGVMLRADYGFSGTSARIDALGVKLARHMKYNSSTFYIQRKHFSDEGWRKILAHEIDYKRPIVYVGYGSDMGHSFVLDGYDTEGRFSVNWGWGGVSNGYYDINAMSPSNQGAGGGAAGYNANQEAVLRILPARDGVDYENFEYITFTETPYVGKGLRLSDPNQVVEPGKAFEITAGRYFNMGCHAYQGIFKLVVTDAQGNIKEDLFTTPQRDLAPGIGEMPLNEQRDHLQLTINGTLTVGDRIRMVYQSLDGGWCPVISDDPEAPWEIVLKASDVQQANIEVSTTVGHNLQGRAVTTFSAEVPMTPSAAGVEAFYAVQKDVNTVELKKIDEIGGVLVIPDHTGVVLATSGAQNFTMQTATQSPAYVPTSNLLRSTTANGTVVEQNVNAYILAKKADEVLFHVLSDSDRKIAANRSYLELPSSMNANSIKMVFDGETTGIEDSFIEMNADAPIFDLSGRQVLNPVKGGIYIQNGKKFIVK